MVVQSEDKNGIPVFWNDELKQWEYENGEKWYDDKWFCARCNKPQLDINGVENCDFCMQGLTVCDFISDACCGHGNDDEAYIALKDGRRFVLDKMNW